MKEMLHHLFEHIFKEHPEKIFFYFVSSVVMITIIVKNDKEIRTGLRGHNALLEAPEIVTYIWTYLFPQVILGVMFLELNPPEYLWWFMLFCLLFALSGREGIQMLFNWRGNKTTVIEKETSSEKTVTNENKTD